MEKESWKSAKKSPSAAKPVRISVTKVFCSRGSRQQNLPLCSMLPDLINFFVWNWRKESFELEATIIQRQPEKKPLGLHLFSHKIEMESSLTQETNRNCSIRFHFDLAFTIEGLNGAGPFVV